MRRAWLGLALLSTSWLFGLGYYQDPNWVAWAVLILLGTGLLAGVRLRRPEAGEAVVAAVMLLPILWLAPWPYRAALVLIFVGLLVSAAPIPRAWAGRVGLGAIAAGVVLVVQAAGMFVKG